jgi:glucokinase
MTRYLLAGDIGGTKADLAVVAAGADGPRVVAETTLPSRKYGGLAELAGPFLRSAGVPVDAACFSVAGPVVDGRARLPNLGWEVDPEELRRALGLARVRVLNDLQATALAVPHLTPEQLLTLQEGVPDPGGLLAVIAPGTGLGEAFLVPDGGAYAALPSEGGHTDFAPADAEQRELLAFLQAETGHVGYEQVCSGIGIANLHRFLATTGRAAEDAGLAARIAAAADPTPLIVEAGLAAAGTGSACARALELFAAILGAEAGNLALRVLATGGVLVGGGIPPRLPALLRGPGFLCAFRRKGPMTALVSRIPVRLVLEPRTALWGAVRSGLAPAAEAAPDPVAALLGAVPS